MKKPLLALCLLALSLPVGCGSDEETPPDPLAQKDGFCKAWAQAACQQKVVDNCNAPSMDDCIESQRGFCLEILPENYSSKRAGACLSAVKAAYKDAALSAEDIAIVIKLGAPCDQLSTGTSLEGESCTKNDDCDTTAGFSCVIKAAETSGSCETPEEVGGGEACDRPAQVCATNFYCDGENCLAYKRTDAVCEGDFQCRPSEYCFQAADATEPTCTERLERSAVCTTNNDCQSLFCAKAPDEAEGFCADSVILSVSEPLCDNLR